MTLDQKVERLERENRYLKRWGVLLFGITILGIVILADWNRPNVVEATKFVLKSEDGRRELGVWGLDERNELSFRCNDDQGNARVKLSVFKARGDIQEQRADIERYGAMLSLLGATYDANGMVLSDWHPRLTLVLKDDERPYVDIVDKIQPTSDPKSAQDPSADPATAASHATFSTLLERSEYAQARLPFSD